MTCQVWVMTPGCTTMQATVLLDSASSTFFIVERSAQCLHLPRMNQRLQIVGIGSALHDPSSHMVFFGAFGLRCKGDSTSPHHLWRVWKQVVLPKITASFPAFPVPFNPRWKHLTRPHLADQDFDTPGQVDVLFGCGCFQAYTLSQQVKSPIQNPFSA